MSSLVEVTPTFKFFSTMIQEGLIEPEYRAYVMNQPTQILRYSMNYLSDLGLRRSENSSIFVLGILGRIDTVKSRSILSSLENDDIFTRKLYNNKAKCDIDYRRLVSNQPAQQVNELLEYYVNRMGSWLDAELICEAILENHDQMIGDHAPILMLNCANIIAIASDIRCLRLYDIAFDAFSDEYTRFTILYRKIVACVKRIGLGQGDLFIKSLQDAHLHISKTGGKSEFCCFCEAMLANITALYYIKISDELMAFNEIKRAMSLIELVVEQEIPGIDREIVGRYYVQIHENYSILLNIKGKFEESLHCIEKIVEFCRRNQKDSLIESLCMCGYNLVMLSRYREAIEILQEARRILHEGYIMFPLIEKRIIEMLVVAYSEIGDENEVCMLIEQLERDDLATPTYGDSDALEQAL